MTAQDAFDGPAVRSQYSSSLKPLAFSSFRSLIVDRDRVIGCVSCETSNGVLNLIDEIESGLRVVGIPVGQDLGDDHTKLIDTEMEFLPRSLAASSVFGCRPLAFANY